MGWAWGTFLRGLAVVLPVALTAAVIYWLGVSLERALGGLIKLWIPDEHYVPGLGIAAGAVLTFALGLSLRAWAIRRLLGIAERLLERVPLAKTIYAGARDLVSFVSSASDSKEADQVVLVTLAEGVRVVGFVTGHGRSLLPLRGGEDEAVPVYLQMSYQLGGYTVFVPRSRLEPIDLGLEDALRWVLTAGVSARRAGSDA